MDWRSFAIRTIRANELFVIRPQSDLGKRFIKSTGNVCEKLEKDSGDSERLKARFEEFDGVASQFAQAQRQEIESLISDLGDAVANTLQRFSESIDASGASIGGMEDVRKGLVEAQKAPNIEETRRLLSQSVVGLQKIVEQQVNRERELRAQYQQHARNLSACLEMAQKEGRTDPLTELPNRRGFEEYAQDAMQAAKTSKVDLSVAMIDLDGFKLLNDTQGHAAGDAALKAFARRLRQAVGDGPFLARLGGDEFVVLAKTTPQVLEAMLNRLSESLESKAMYHEGQTLKLGASFGTAPLGPMSVLTEVLKAADSECYRRKLARKSSRAA